MSLADAEVQVFDVPSQLPSTGTNAVQRQRIEHALQK